MKERVAGTLALSVVLLLSFGVWQAAGQVEDQFLIVPGERLGNQRRLSLSIDDLNRRFGSPEQAPAIHRNALLWRETRVFAFVCDGAIGTLGVFEPRAGRDPLERTRWATREEIGIRSTTGETIARYGTPGGQHSRVAFSSTDGNVPVVIMWWTAGSGAGLFGEFRQAVPQRAWALAVFRREGERCF